MLNKQAIEKKYFQFIKPGHYIDVQTSDSQWKLAKVIEKDKKYVYVAYDGYINKEDQFFINSYRVAPLRAFTQGFTGQIMKINRNNIPKVEDLKNFIKIAQQKFLYDEKSTAFQITQLLRGQLFVYIHDLLCKEYSLNQNEIQQANSLLYQFLDLAIKMFQKAIQYKLQYFTVSSLNNKLLYLNNNKIALIQSLQQILILIQIIIKTQNYKFAYLFKYNKQMIPQQKFAQYFLEKKGLQKLFEIFILNDKNGKWYPSSIRKSIYKIMLRYTISKNQFVMPKLPKYLVKDFQQFFSIYPFMCKYSPQIQLENQFIDFSINILLTNSPFDAKLKAIQQIRKVLQGKNQFQFLDKNKILAKIDQMGVFQQLLDNKNFNPQVFKRFVPILNIVCKVKSLNIKHIHALFQIVNLRHQSQAGIIFQIISQICEFAPSAILDNVFSQICKIDINSQQTLNFIKTFTIKAIENISKQKSYFGGLFGKKKGSSKYGYYGLNLIFKQSHDEGRISKQKILYALNVLKQILCQNRFSSQRQTYLSNSVEFIKKKKNFGQSIKLICLILSTFEEASFFSQDRKKVIERLETKSKIIDYIIEGLKNVQSIICEKFSRDECFQYFYELIEMFSAFIRIPLKVNQIQYLWYKTDSNHLLNYLRKQKQGDKFKKILAPQIIQQIFNEIFKKSSFYKRPLTFKQFQTIFQLFVSYHLQKENISMHIKDGLIRFNKTSLLGMNYFINFLQHSKQQQNFQKTSKKVIQLILRPNLNGSKFPNLQSFVQYKTTAWKDFFKIMIQKLINIPDKCLLFIQIFYSCIQGRLYKQLTINETSNLQVLVQYDDQQKKISIQRFSTIYRLRRLIKQKFKIQYDFNMFNFKLNKFITFEEEQDFSVNAMPLVDNGKGLTIKVQQKQNKYHQQQLSVMAFKQLIEKEEALYDLIFKIVEQQNLPNEIEKQFWKTIQLLPLNKSMMAQIQRCDNFNEERWRKYLKSSSESSLQYKLGIILNLIKASERWTSKMQKTEGLISIMRLLEDKLEEWNYRFENEILAAKILEIIEKSSQKNSNKQNLLKQLKNVNAHLIKALETQFTIETQEKGKLQETKDVQVSTTQVETTKSKNISQPNITQTSKVKVSLMIINKSLQIYLTNLKILSNHQEKQFSRIKLETFILILDHSLFVKKSQSSQKFAEEISVSVYYSIFNNVEDRKILLDYLIQQLQLQKLFKRQRTQNYFKFLNTILYSYQQDKIKTIKGNNQQIKKEIYDENSHNYYKKIEKYIIDVIEHQNLKDYQKQTEHLIYGCFSLLKFFLCKLTQTSIFQHNLKQIFQKLIHYFLFPISQEYAKRIKTQKNKKILFENLKKICYQDTSVIKILTDKLIPFLQKNKYRKNTMMSWNLHFQNSQKKFFVGLQNLGATCYLNCLFQQLFMIKKFRESFIEIDSRLYKEELQKNEIYQLQKLFYSLKFNDRRSQTTKKFCSSFITFEGQPINPVAQSDADQFFNTLMDRIQTFLRQTGKHEILESTFQGKLSNQLNCQGCPHRSQKIQNFMSIGVNLKNKKTLQQALKGYVQGQILDGDNAYYCELCQKKVRTVKRLCVKELPNILVIVLKRFQYDFDTYKKIKLNSYLQFPQKLDMTEYTAQFLQSKSMQKLQASSLNLEQNQNNKISNKIQYGSNNFHLRGTVIHAGTADAGHYYSFIKQNSKWYEFNDQHVNQIAYSKIQEQGFGGEQKDIDEFKMQKYKNAYILFYQRENTRNDIDFQQAKMRKNHNQIIQLSQSNNKQIQLESFNYNKDDFSKYMTGKILQQNYESNIFSSLLEQNFIHFWQNLSILENNIVRKFIILYFHTVILRDKLRYQHASNYFRIVIQYLSNTNHDKKKISQYQENSSGKQNQSSNQIAQWFLQQINRAYIKQFLIQAPRTVRFICTSLVLTAINYSYMIPQQFPLMLMSSIRKIGMSPFGLIFKALSKRQMLRNRLQQLNYSKTITSLLIQDKKIQQLKLPQPQYQIESYFGSDCSEVQAQRQKCSAALIESLQEFDNIGIQNLTKINDVYSFRKSNKVVLKKLVQEIYKQIQNGNKTQQTIINLVKGFEQTISRNNNGRQFVEKYLLLIRFLVLENQQQLKQKIYEIVKISLQNFIFAFAKLYEPMDWVMRQITKISVKNKQFKIIWKKAVEQNSSLKIEIQSWLRQIEKPQLINLKDDFFQKLRQMDIAQKIQYLKKYSLKMKTRIAWIFDEKQQNGQNDINIQESQFEEVEQNEIIQIRNRAFKVKEKYEQSILYQVSYPDKQDHYLWAYLEKCEIETINNL